MTKPKTDRKKRIEQADAVWRWIVKERGAGRCQYNGCFNRGEEAHHIFSRRNMSVRFDPDNGIWLCPDCHRYAHAHPENFNAVLWLELGLVYEALQVKSKVVVQYRNHDLLEIIERLKNGG